MILRSRNAHRRVDDFSFVLQNDSNEAMNLFKVKKKTYDAWRRVDSLGVQWAQVVAFVSSSIDDEVIVLDE